MEFNFYGNGEQSQREGDSTGRPDNVFTASVDFSAVLVIYWFKYPYKTLGLFDEKIFFVT